MQGHEVSLEDLYREIQELKGIVAAMQMDVQMIKMRPYIEDPDNPKWYKNTDTGLKPPFTITCSGDTETIDLQY